MKKLLLIIFMGFSMALLIQNQGFCKVFKEVTIGGGSGGGGTSTAPYCGDGICQAVFDENGDPVFPDTEDYSTCQADCPVPTCLAYDDPNTLENERFCDAGEDNANCGVNCPAPTCGDGVCQAVFDENGDPVFPDTEDYSTCQADCPVPTCLAYDDPNTLENERFCDAGEDNANCGVNCPAPTCGDGVCQAVFDEYGDPVFPDTEDYFTCQTDCPVPTCLAYDDPNTEENEMLCDTYENNTNCAVNCPAPTCGDGICESELNEDPVSCPADCESVPVKPIVQKFKMLKK